MDLFKLFTIISVLFCHSLSFAYDVLIADDIKINRSTVRIKKKTDRNQNGIPFENFIEVESGENTVDEVTQWLNDPKNDTRKLVIFMDFEMKEDEMTGAQTICAIRNIERQKGLMDISQSKIRIIGYSDNAPNIRNKNNKSNNELMKEVGADTALKKPASLQDMSDAIDKALATGTRDEITEQQLCNELAKKDMTEPDFGNQCRNQEPRESRINKLLRFIKNIFTCKTCSVNEVSASTQRTIQVQPYESQMHSIVPL